MWVGVVIIVELAVITLCKRWYWIFPTKEVSELYTHYAGTGGINATFFKDYRVRCAAMPDGRDDIFVDVTVLEATTDSAWNMLQSDFEVPVMPDEIKELSKGHNYADFWLASKDNPKMHPDTNYGNNVLVVTSEQMKTICVFHIENKNQMKSIINYKTKELSSNDNK